MRLALHTMTPYPELELLWASPREVLNVRQADDLGVHIITVTHDLLKKLALFGGDLDTFSLETVRMFHNDAATAGAPLVTTDRALPVVASQALRTRKTGTTIGTPTARQPRATRPMLPSRAGSELLGGPQAGSTVLDIGSGQGDLAHPPAGDVPDVAVWGVDTARRRRVRPSAAAAQRGCGQFTQLDLVQPATLDHGQPPPSYAVCSEVLEHVDDPVLLLLNQSTLLAPGCRISSPCPAVRVRLSTGTSATSAFQGGRPARVLTDAGL